jgi:polygalacturonase
MNKSRKQKQFFNAISIFILFIVGSLSAADLPFVVPNIKAPKFRNKTFCITDFGAVDDGHTKNTKAFAEAINACADAGGGTVLVPAGLWLTGPIIFKSNINLHLKEGAIILFSPDFEDYPLIKTIWEGQAQVRCVSPLYAEASLPSTSAHSRLCAGCHQSFAVCTSDYCSEG